MYSTGFRNMTLYGSDITNAFEIICNRTVSIWNATFFHNRGEKRRLWTPFSFIVIEIDNIQKYSHLQANTLLDPFRAKVLFWHHTIFQETRTKRPKPEQWRPQRPSLANIRQTCWNGVLLYFKSAMVLDPLEAKCKLATQICKSDWSKWIFAKIGNAWVISINQMYLPIARMSGHPILSPRRTATTKNVENNQQNGQSCTNSNSHVKVGIVGKKCGLVIIGMVIVFVSVDSRRVDKKIRLLITHFTKFQISNQIGSWSLESCLSKTGIFISCCYTAITNKASSHTWS